MITEKNSQDAFEQKIKAQTNGDDAINVDAEDITPAAPRAPYNPLTAAGVNEKSYAKPQIPLTDDERNRPISEPSFTPPPASAMGGATPAGPKPPTPPPPPVNPAMADLPNKEKKNAAKAASEMAISGYKALHQLGNLALQIGDSKVKKLVRKGLIDLNAPLQLASGAVPMGTFIQHYNSEVSDVFTVTQDFIDEIQPPLQRVMEKKGIGATDENLIIYYLGKDLAFKAPRFASLIAQRNQTINELVELSEQWKKTNGRPAQNMQPPMPPPVHNPPPPPPQPPADNYKSYVPPFMPPPIPPQYAQQEMNNGVQFKNNDSVYDTPMQHRDNPELFIKNEQEAAASHIPNDVNINVAASHFSPVVSEMGEVIENEEFEIAQEVKDETESLAARVDTYLNERIPEPPEPSALSLVVQDEETGKDILVPITTAVPPVGDESKNKDKGPAHRPKGTRNKFNM